MDGFIALRVDVTSPHIYMLAPSYETHRDAIAAVLGAARDTHEYWHQWEYHELTAFLLQNLMEVTGATSIYTYQSRLIADLGPEISDAYPLIDLAHSSVSWYNMSTPSALARVSFDTIAEAPTAA